MNMISPVADANALCQQAAWFLDAGRPGSARPLLTAARALDCALPELTLMEVRLALTDGEVNRAIETLDKAILIHPAHPGLRKRRADVRNRIGDWEGAARDAAEAVTLGPADPEPMALLGTALLDLGRVKDAVTCLRQAVAAAPAVVSYRQALCRALEQSGDAAAALRVLNDGIAQGPVNVGLYNAASLLNIRRRDFLQATELTEQAVQAGVADATTFGLRGHALCSLDRHDEAALAYHEAVKLAPNDPQIRHLATAHGIGTGATRAPVEYVKQAFDLYADRFEMHLGALGYSVPQLIGSILEHHPDILKGQSIGPVLDLGCGTGLVAMALGELPVGPFTGVDVSCNMLAQARLKRLYSELREADIVADLANQQMRWPLIIAADVLSYFGDLQDVLVCIHQRLQPGGWFIFSVETLQPDRDGIVAGNGNWALHRQGRYAHAHDYLYECVGAAGLRVLRKYDCTIRREAGGNVPGLLMIVGLAVL